MKLVIIMAVVAIVALGAYTCVVIFFPDDITKLAKRGVPLPRGQMTTIATESGGTFAQYIFAAVQLDEPALTDYIEVLKGTCPEADVISPASNCVVVTSAMSAKTLSSYSSDPNKKLLFKQADALCGCNGISWCLFNRVVGYVWGGPWARLDQC